AALSRCTLPGPAASGRIRAVRSTVQRANESNMSSPRTAWKFDAEVGEQGRVTVQTPLPPRARVEVIVLQPADEFADLAAAAGSSLGFWDNPLDDEDWNDAGP